jgi:hypothetical protein
MLKSFCLLICITTGLLLYFYRYAIFPQKHQLTYQSNYTIDMIFMNEDTPDDIKMLCINAKKRWESIITSDIPSKFVYENGTSCGNINVTKLGKRYVVDDLLIFVDINYIDGRGRVLGQAGPCKVAITNNFIYSRVGYIKLDTADILNENVIIHEIGHVIGIGSLWGINNLYNFTNDVVKYIGVNGINGNKLIGGPIDGPVLESGGSIGTIYKHWDNNVYQNEIMTGYVRDNMLISQLTAQSLKDIGHLGINNDFIDDYRIYRRRLRSEASSEVNEEQRHTSTISYQMCNDCLIS